VGRLYTFESGRTPRQKAKSEERLSKLFYANARTDVDYLLRVYLYKYYGQEVYPDIFAKELRDFRETQSFMPSTAEISLKMPFDMAISGGRKTVQTAMRQQKHKWAQSAVNYKDENYLDAVIASVVSDDTALIDYMTERLMQKPKSLKAAALQVRKMGHPDHVVNKLTNGLQNHLDITGTKLREKVEAMAGCKIARECKDGKIQPLKHAELLPFNPRRL
jgi:hypothetical protein